jgi:predicted DNA-binding protein
VQEHLAQQLRAAYQETAEKPAFLGDPALPPELEDKVEKLAERERAIVREKAHHLATEAVEAALEEVVSGTLTPEELAAASSGRGGQRDGAG